MEYVYEPFEVSSPLTLSEVSILVNESYHEITIARIQKVVNPESSHLESSRIL